MLATMFTQMEPRAPRKLNFCVVGCIGIIIAFGLIQLNTALIPNTAERPIIGIVSQTITDKLLHKFIPYSKNRSYIATSYVKFVQAAGARVVPILDTYDEKNLTVIFNSLNGIIFPGGGSSLKNSKFVKTVKKLMKLAIQYNANGGYFPILGICLGFEAMHVYFEKKRNFLSPLNAENKSLPIKFAKGISTSRMFFNLTKELKNALEKQALTANFHQDGVHPSWYKRSRRLAKQYRLLATSLDRNGKPFVAAMEGSLHILNVFTIKYHDYIVEELECKSKGKR